MINTSKCSQGHDNLANSNSNRTVFKEHNNEQQITISIKLDKDSKLSAIKLEKEAYKILKST